MVEETGPLQAESNEQESARLDLLRGPRPATLIPLFLLFLIPSLLVASLFGGALALAFFGWCMAIALWQSFGFRTRPRMAAVLFGTISLTAIAIVIIYLKYLIYPDSYYYSDFSLHHLPAILVGCFFFGPPFGYVLGVAITDLAYWVEHRLFHLTWIRRGFLWKTDERKHDGGPGRLDGTIAVPRRFGLGTIFVVTTAAALLFAGLNALSAPPLLLGWVFALVAVIAIAQPFLFHGNHPRRTSIVVGSVYTVVTGWTWAIYDSPARYPYSIHVEGMIVGCLVILIFSPLVGYLAGAAVAGIFWCMTKFEAWRNPTPVAADEATTPASDDPLA